VSDSYDQNHQNLILNFVNNSVITNTDAIPVRAALELLNTYRSRLVGKGINLGDEALLDVLG